MAENLLNFSVSDAVEKTEDFVGFEPVPTGFYQFRIKTAYVSQSQKKARFVALEGTLVSEIDSKETPFNENVYFTSNIDKGCSPYYERNGKTFKLPGLEMLDNICEIITGKALRNQDTEEKLVEVWEDGARKKAPRQALIDLEGQEILVAVNEILQNKREQNAAGMYVETSETRKINQLAKALYPEGLTYNEKLDGIQETVWKGKWSKNVGKTLDQTKKVAGGSSVGTAGQSAPLAKPTLGAKKL